jgi:hypothetical protein
MEINIFLLELKQQFKKELESLHFLTHIVMVAQSVTSISTNLLIALRKLGIWLTILQIQDLLILHLTQKSKLASRITVSMEKFAQSAAVRLLQNTRE